MAAIREWRCLEHGEFEASHPICPNFGCESKFVKQEFRTAPSFRSDYTKRTDKGIRKSADMYGINNFKSGKAGDVSFAGHAPLGQKLLWGDEAKKTMGKSFAELSTLAAQPLTVKKRDGTEATLTRNNAMREAATDLGITRRRVPKAGEITSDQKPAA